MSDRKQALQDLLAKVEAGECDHGSFLQYWRKDTAYSGGCGVNAHKAYDGSLDAARALHDAALPDWHFDVATEANGGGFYAAISPKAWGVSFIACSDTPARAWLIAILKALIAESDT